MKFYIGMSNVSHAWAFPRVMIPVTALDGRWTSFRVNNWIMDSGAFKQIINHGRFDMPVRAYAAAIKQWKLSGNLVGAVAQDWICDPIVRQRTGHSIGKHQELTIKNYVDLLPHVNGTRIIPVLQGYKSADYVQHLRDYGTLLRSGQWVAVGSIVSRSSDIVQIRRILEAIKSERSDLNLHGFGLKLKSLMDPAIKSMLFSSDSIAWANGGRHDSQKAFMEGKIELAAQLARDQDDPRVALRYAIKIQQITGEEELINWWKR